MPETGSERDRDWVRECAPEIGRARVLETERKIEDDRDWEREREGVWVRD